MRKYFFVFFTLAVITLLSAGCLRRGSSASPQGKTDGPDEFEVVVKADKLKIYFIPKNMGNAYFDALSSGFYSAMTQLGEDNFQYYYTGPDTAEAASQIPFLEEAIQDKADAVFIAANSSSALNETFDKARKQGIRIYIINQDIPDNEARRDAAIMPVDFNTIGDSLISDLGRQMNYEGKFAILSATEDAPDQNTWIDLVKQELYGDPQYSGMELVEVVYGDDQHEKSTEEAKALLQRQPDLKGLLVPTAVGLPAAAAIIREKGLSGKIKITGLGLPSEMAEFILDGTCESFQLWNPPYEGQIGVYLVWAEKRLGFNPVPGARFSAGRLGDYEILPNGQILTLKSPMVYNLSNIREYAILF
ncbi:MAG: substrate-binding domain-containing protein [Treponema sp.]|jgi:rhamnose transport system substrate-binding protein|nr:substrate-binding domain-containing protein [Treponema sp.]